MSGDAADKRHRRGRDQQRGDEAQLFERYASRLVRAVKRTIGAPRDIAEEACAIAWLQLLRTQPERDAIFAWLRVVATREALRLLKARGAGAFEVRVDSASGREERGADLQLAIEVREALEQIAALTPQQIQIFSLHLAGFSYEEISELTGYTRRTVERHVIRARGRLRKFVKP